MSEQLPLSGPRKGDCGCGCGRFGTLRSAPWRSNGITCVRRGCTCRQCTGLVSKRRGARSQRAGKRELAIASASSLRTGHEENDDTPWENKAGARFTGPAFTAWEAAEAQYEANRPIGRGPLAFLRMTHPDRRYSLISIRGDRLYEAWKRLGIKHGWLDRSGGMA